MINIPSNKKLSLRIKNSVYLLLLLQNCLSNNFYSILPTDSTSNYISQNPSIKNLFKIITHSHSPTFSSYSLWSFTLSSCHTDKIVKRIRLASANNRNKLLELYFYRGRASKTTTFKEMLNAQKENTCMCHYTNA